MTVHPNSAALLLGEKSGPGERPGDSGPKPGSRRTNCGNSIRESSSAVEERKDSILVAGSPNALAMRRSRRGVHSGGHCAGANVPLARSSSWSDRESYPRTAQNRLQTSTMKHLVERK